MHIDRRSCISLAVMGLLKCSAAAAIAEPQGDVPQSAADTLSLDHQATTLDRLLNNVSKQSGLKLRPARERRGSRIALHVRDRPIDRIRAELAALLDNVWSRDGADAAGWLTLGPDVRSRSFRHRQLLQWYKPPMESLLNYAGHATRERADRPPMNVTGDAASRRFEPPPVDRKAHPGRYAALRLLLSLSQEQVVDCLTGGLYLRWSQMRPEQRELAVAVVDEMASVSPVKLPSVAGAQLRLREMGLVVSVGLASQSNASGSYMVSLGDAILAFRQIRGPNHRLPNDNLLAVRGNPYPLRRARTGSASSSKYRDLETIPFPARDFREPFPCTWPRIFRQLPGRLPFALYSDAFAGRVIGRDAATEARDPDGPQNPPRIPVDRLSLAAGLDALCKRYGRIWWRDGDALFFRSRTWFLDEMYDVPPEILEHLAQQVTAKGKLDAQGMDLLASLTEQQLIGIHRIVEEEYGPVRWKGRERSTLLLLHIYSMLTPAQKNRILGAGLPVSAMTMPQRQAYREALFLSRAPVALVDNPPVLQFDQTLSETLIQDTKGKKVRLNELAVYLLPSQTRVDTSEEARRRRARLASLTIPVIPDDPPLSRSLR